MRPVAEQVLLFLYLVRSDPPDFEDVPEPDLGIPVRVAGMHGLVVTELHDVRNGGPTSDDTHERECGDDFTGHVLHLRLGERAADVVHE